MELKEEAAKKAAEALAQANDVGRNNLGALETRLEALETRFNSTCAFYKGKFEEQERDHQELMALSDERLKKLEKQERAHPELEQQLWMQQEEHHR